MNDDVTTRLDAIEQRANAATPGPWEAFDENDDSAHSLWSVANDAYFNPSADEDVPWIGAHVRVGHRSDAEFIAHARQDVPWLIERIEIARAVLRDAIPSEERREAQGTHSPNCHQYHIGCLVTMLRRVFEGEAP